MKTCQHSVGERTRRRLLPQKEKVSDLQTLPDFCSNNWGEGKASVQNIQSVLSNFCRLVNVVGCRKCGIFPQVLSFRCNMMSWGIWHRTKHSLSSRSISPVEKGWEKWGCSAGEGRVLWRPHGNLGVSEGPTREPKRDPAPGPGEAQGGMGSDWINAGNSLL